MIVYIAGPYRAKGDRTVADNIQQAREAAIKVWEAGHVALCPHLNTANFDQDCEADIDDYLAGDRLMLARCDAVLVVGNWQESEGCLSEIELANLIELPVYDDPDKLPPPAKWDEGTMIWSAKLVKHDAD